MYVKLVNMIKKICIK